jgi:hypothetical protein
MTSAVVSLNPALPRATSEDNGTPATRMYRTKTSFVAVHIDEVGKGRIDFLPKGARLRIIGPSSLLPEGFEVKVDHRIHHVFETDLIDRSSVIFESSRTKRIAVGACCIRRSQ